MTVVITGATSGIGLATAEKFIEMGHTVYSLSRRECSVDGVISIKCDITDKTMLENAVKRIDRVDVLINNAGFGISGAVEFTTEEEMKSQFELNYFAQISVTNAFLPKLKESRGAIIFTSSAAAVFSIPFQSFYSATKAAVESMCCALANELKMFGVRVGCVRLGDIKTGFTAAREKSFAGDDVYQGKISKSVAVMEHDEQNGMSSSTVADVIYKLSLKKSIPVVTTVGIQYKFLCGLAKKLPVNAVNRLIGRIYIPG